MQDKMRKTQVTFNLKEEGIKKFFQDHPRYRKWVKKLLQSDPVKTKLNRVEENYSKEVAKKLEQKIEERVRVNLTILYLEYYFGKGRPLTEKELSKNIKAENFTQFCFLEEMLQIFD